jgi:LCP family protein required for cell wall assembly
MTVVGIALLILAILVAGGGYAYVRYRYAQLHREQVNNLTDSDISQPFNVLMVGSDSRAGEPSSAIQHFGSSTQVQGQRSDVVSILHVVPQAHSAAILSIPRDLFVPIAGTNGSNRINTAFNGGPSQLVATIENDLGITIRDYVEVNFGGFQGAVDSLGGVKLDFPYRVRDVMSGLNITATGCQLLNGAAALSVARSRDYQYYAYGYWHYDPTGDLGRIRRQHVFLKAVAKEALSKGLTNPFTANAFLGSVVHDFTIDDRMSLGDMVALARDFRSFNPNNMATYTLPTRPVNGYLGFGDVLFPVEPQDQQVIAQFLSSPSPGQPTQSSPGTTLAPSSVRVEVLNGAGTAGLASRVASELRQAGFVVTTTGNAGSFTYTEAVVHYAPGQLAKAQTLEAQITGGALLRADASLTGSDVALVVGSQWQGLKGATGTSVSGPGSVASTTTTTVPSGEASLPPYDPRTC